MKYICLFLLVPLLSFGQNLNQSVEELFQSKTYAEAETQILQHLKSNPDDFIAIELLGDAYGYQKKWDKSIAQYKRLVTAKPNEANYQYKYGGAMGMKAMHGSKLRALGLIGDVKKALLKASELSPEHIDVRWALVELYIQIPGIIGGSKRKALRYANELEQFSKVDGYLAKGYIYEYDDEPVLAETYYKKALEVGGSLTCYEKLSSFYEKDNRPQKAIANIAEAYKKYSRNNLHYQIGKIAANYNVQLDKGERCLQLFVENHTVKDGVPLEWAFLRLAQIQKHKKNKPEALEWIGKALAIRTDFKQALKEKQEILLL